MFASFVYIIDIFINRLLCLNIIVCVMCDCEFVNVRFLHELFRMRHSNGVIYVEQNTCLNVCYFDGGDSELSVKCDLILVYTRVSITFAAWSHQSIVLIYVARIGHLCLECLT